MGDPRDGRNNHVTLEKLILPEVFEPVRRQGRVAHRGHDRSVAEVGLDGASIVAVIGELEPAGMPQHVGMHEEREFRSHARPGNHALISGCGQRRVTFRDEDVRRRWGFAQELAQRAAFPRRYRMHAGIPALGPTYMQAPDGEVDIIPAQRHQLRGPKPVAVSDQDCRGVRRCNRPEGMFKSRPPPAAPTEVVVPTPCLSIEALPVGFSSTY
jgi:hypothetical protein